MRGLVLGFAMMFASAASAQTLDDLSWLTGCWRTGASENGVVTEVWTAPPMPTMLGYSYTTQGGETRGWEQTRIEMIDGWPHFVAMPNGASPVAFRLHDPNDVIVLDADDLAVFENPEHDYPQTVGYARFGNRLSAWIAGPNESNTVRSEYRRIRCPIGPRP
jgi:hypothetical protein